MAISPPSTSKNSNVNAKQRRGRFGPQQQHSSAGTPQHIGTKPHGTGPFGDSAAWQNRVAATSEAKMNEDKGRLPRIMSSSGKAVKIPGSMLARIRELNEQEESSNTTIPTNWKQMIYTALDGTYTSQLFYSVLRKTGLALVWFIPLSCFLKCQEAYPTRDYENNPFSPYLDLVVYRPPSECDRFRQEIGLEKRDLYMEIHLYTGSVKHKGEYRITTAHMNPVCDSCGSDVVKLRCSGCQVAWYCNADCQRKSWSHHRTVCALLEKGRHALLSQVKAATEGNHQ